MKRNKTIELLKTFVGDRIRQCRNDVAGIYSSEEEQHAQLEELRQIETSSRLQNSVFKYAKWYSGCNEIIVLENILWKLKEMESQSEKETKLKDEKAHRKG